DPSFWAPFANSWSGMRLRSKREERAPALRSRNATGAPRELTTISIDVSDLLLSLLDHLTVSGLQRVQCEIVRNLLDLSHPREVRFVIVNGRGRLGEIETSGLLDIVEHIRSDATSGAAT